jgi:CHAT domain-containing protein
MKEYKLKKRLGYPIVALFLIIFLAGCASVKEMWEIKKMGDNMFTISDQELQTVLQQPLPQEPGFTLDIALSKRAFAGMLLADLESVRDTKRITIQSGTNENMIVTILGMVASAESMSGNPNQARIEYSAIEKRLLDNNTPSSIFSNASHHGFLISYLEFSLSNMDWKVGDRLLANYFDPGANDQSLDLEGRFKLQVAADNYRFGKLATLGDPKGAYIARSAALEQYKAGPLQQLKKSNDVPTSWKYKESLFRNKLGIDAVNAGQPEQAIKHLNILKGIWDGKDPLIAMNIFELEQQLYWHLQDYNAALNNMTAYTEKYPLMVNRIPAVKSIFQMGRTQYLTGLGRWVEALDNVEGVRKESTNSLITEYKIGYTTLIEAQLGRPISTLNEFKEAEPRFRNGKRGVQAGIGYYGISTTVFWQLASRNGNLDDLQMAITSGQRMGEALRNNKYRTNSPTSPLPAPALQDAKNAYANAVIQGMEKRLANYDDLLNAIQILQMSESDRDIAAMALRLSSIPGVKPEKLRTLQDLQRQVWTSQNELLSLAMANDTASADEQNVSRKAQNATAEFNALLDEISQAQPSINQLLTSPKALKLKDIQRNLSSGEALLAIAPLADSTLILLISKERARYRVAKVAKQQIDELVERIRKTTTFDENVSVPDFDTSAASELYNILLRWSDSSLAQINNLKVTTTGALSSLPFSLLLRKPIKAETASYGRAQWLIKDMGITQMPTLNAWYSLSQNKSVATGKGFIAWADPYYGGEVNIDNRLRGAVVIHSPNKVDNTITAIEALPANMENYLPALPETLDEAKAIAKVLSASPKMDVISGALATRTDVLKRSASGELLRKNVLLFATHGLAPGELPGLSQPALAMARENGENQLLTLADVMELRLSADWVILSACNTASADRLGGDPMSGLARGFFFTGARGLLLTHWSVESESAAVITAGTIEEYMLHPKKGHGEALRKVSLRLIAATDTQRQWQHPAYWAPFAVVGGQ